MLSISGQAFCAEKTTNNTESEIEQKACQNIFSLINIDLSFMSPRANLTDANVDASSTPKAPKFDDRIIPVTNKKDIKSCPPPNFKSQGSQLYPPCEPKPEQKNRTSLFRLDLFHLFKIQIL